MFQLARAYQKPNKACFVFRKVYHLILCKPGTAFSSTEAKAENENVDNENDGKNESGVFRSSKMNYRFKKIDYAGYSKEKVNETDYVKKPLIKSLESMVGVDQYVKFVDNGSPTDAVQVLSYFSRKGFKTPDVFKAIVSNLKDAPTKFFTLKQCSDILYYCSNLSFKEENFIERIVSEVLKHPLNSESRKFSPLILRSLGSLKYKDSEMIENLLKNILEYPKDSKLKDIITSLMTLSIINFKSPYTMILLKELNSFECSKFSGTKQYLDFVWASVILNEMDTVHISKVLSKDFVEALRTYGGVRGGNEIINLKLQNINAAASNLLPSYNGPLLGNIFSRPLPSRSKVQFLSQIVDGLCHVFPRNGYFKTSKDLKTGFIVDVEFIVDSKGEPLLKTPGNKVALQLLDFNDFCIGKEKSITGINVFKHRILESLGYKVITVSYKEYHKDLTLNEKISILKNKIKSICGEKTESDSN